jgi:hypothetical protein
MTILEAGSKFSVPDMDYYLTASSILFGFFPLFLLSCVMVVFDKLSWKILKDRR